MGRSCFESVLRMPAKGKLLRWLSAAAQAQRPVEGPEGTRLASQAFEAINEAVRSAAADTLPLVGQLIPLTLQKLNATLAMAAAAPDARERQSEMQARLARAQASTVPNRGLPRQAKVCSRHACADPQP